VVIFAIDAADKAVPVVLLQWALQQWRWDEIAQEGQDMSEERAQILQMLMSGRVTIEQADQLLEALGTEFPAGAHEPATGTGRHGRRDDRTAGFVAGLTPEQLIELRNHGVSGAFVQQMRAAGLGDLRVDDLIELYDHDVTPRFVRELREAGFSGLTCHELVELVNHGVSASFMRQMRDAGLGEVAPDQLVELYNHGVDAAFVREMRDLGFDNLAPNALIELYDHGVDGDFVREIRGPSDRGERESAGE
jgi:hypothetical protein